MTIPSQKDIRLPLLHLIYTMGGEVRLRDVYDILADHFKVTEKERQETVPSGLSKKFDNRVAWARHALCSLGFLAKTAHGVWKITEKGRQELSHFGLIDKAFPNAISLKGQISYSPRGAKKGKSDDEELLELVLEEIATDGLKKFPDDFLDDDCSDFYEIDLPGTQLYLAPKTETIITSPKGYFRYVAKNPPEAKYILYAHEKGLKKVKIPKDNLILFKAVKSYERYCDEVRRRSFELFLEFTYDEHKAEILTTEIANRLDLRAKKKQG